MPEPAAEFDALAEEFYAVWFRYHPDLALAAGVPGFGSALPAQDDDDLAALSGWLEALILGLDEVDFASLDADRQLDYRLMAGAARFEHRDLLDFDWRRRDPLQFLPLAEIHRLTLESPDDLQDQLASLLAAVPEYLRQAQGQLRAGVELLAAPLVRAAARDTESGRCYLRDLVRGPWLRRHCDGLAELERLAEQACDALVDYRECLLGELAPEARGALGCGAERLVTRLAELHFMDVDPDACRDLLAGALARVEDALALSSGRSESVGLAGPGSGAGPDAGRQPSPSPGVLCGDLAREIEASGLVSLPSARLRVRSWPACPQSGRLQVDYLADREGGGTLYLPSAIGAGVGTGIGPGIATGTGPGIADPEDWVRSLCLAEGWGGSHLFTWSDPGRAQRMPRRLANGASLGIGWSLYLGLRLAESAPGRRPAALRRQRDQLLLALLDLDLHCGLADEDDAARRLGTLGLVGPAADAELARLAHAPGDALAGALGWLLLEAAREQLERDQGTELDERRFHDRLVSHGRVPLPLVLRHGLGDSLWGRVSSLVFGG